MALYFIAGVSLGVVIPHCFSEKQFEITRTCILGPFQAFRYLKQDKLKKDIAMEPGDYFSFLRLICKNMLTLFQ
jgi:hypothetical protein